MAGQILNAFELSKYGGVIPGMPPPQAPATQPSTPLQNQYKLYNSGVAQNANDYNDIMSGYKSLLQKSQNTSAPTINPINPQSYTYSPTADYTSAVGNLSDLSQTGGYSEQNINDIRARGISPIRSVYAGAMRDVDRQRALQGGFSPNYAAVRAKMAREMSDQIANQVTNVNAGIAQNVAGNRLQASVPLASTTAQGNALSNQIGQRNTENMNEASKFNSMIPLEQAKLNQSNTSSQADALRGMTSLYGTTPALANLFGTQAMQANQMADNEARSNNQQKAQSMDQVLAALRSNPLGARYNG